MRTGRVAATVLLGWLLALPAALAASGSLSGHAALPLRLEGTVAAEADRGFLHLAGDGGQATLQLTGDATLTRVVQRAFGIVSSQDPQAEVLWQQRQESIDLELAGGTLALEGRLPQFQALAIDGRQRLAPARSLLVGGLSEPQVVEERLRRVVSVQLNPLGAPFQATIPAGTFQSRSEEGSATVSGAFRIFLSDARLALERGGARQDIPAHARTETRPGSVYNPLQDGWSGPGTHTEYVQEHLLVTARDAQLRIAHRGVPATASAASPVLSVEGTAFLPALRGTVTVEAEDGPVTHALSGQDLTLAGRFTLRPYDADAGATGAQVAGSGDFTTVSYGAVEAHYPWETLAAVGLGALALAAAAWLLANGKAILGAGGGLLAGYARVQGEGILEHPGRAEAYERIKESPGIGFTELERQLGFGASTLTYHLRVLERNEYVNAVRDGRYLRLFDRRSGAYAGHKKVAASALRNPTTAAMARHIRDHPGVAQCDLATAFGVAPSTVTWHVNRLHSAGLLEKGRNQARTSYFLSQGWAELPATESQRLEATPILA